MNKGYAFGFILVLLVLGLGLYVAFTGFMSTRETIRAVPTDRGGAGVARVVRTLSPPDTATATVEAPENLTAVPGSTETTIVAIAPEEPTLAPVATQAPEAGPTQGPPPPTAQPGASPTAFAPPPTPVPLPAYQFRVGGPPAPDPNYPNCCYIFGTVVDASGAGIEGALVQASNEWNQLPPAPTKGGAEAGQYNIPLGHEAVTWELVVVDVAGSQVSTKVTIPFDPVAANGYHVDWKRTY